MLLNGSLFGASSSSLFAAAVNSSAPLRQTFGPLYGTPTNPAP